MATLNLHTYHPPWSTSYLKKKSWQARIRAVIEEEKRLNKIDETINEMLELAYERTQDPELVSRLREKLTA